MALELRSRVEVEVVHSVLDELDYYKILKLKGGAPMGDVERAFAEQSKTFHPDRFFGVRDPKFMRKVTAVFKKIQESYSVLRDPELKKMYDQKMGHRKGGGGGHVDKAALEREKAALESDEVVQDKRAKKYWELAQIALQGKDWNGAVMNLQFALTYESGNVILEDRLQFAKDQLEQKKRDAINPYKIKIV